MFLLRASFALLLPGLLFSTAVLTPAQKDSRTKDAARHASDASCAACHKRIDPLGFGLENFDAIGRYRATHGGEAIDASGTLPGGQKFTGPRELKKIVLARQDDAAHCAASRCWPSSCLAILNARLAAGTPA